MKKLVLFMFMAFSLSNISIAEADRYVKAEELPSDAKNFLKIYFSDSQIEGIVQESSTNDFEVTTYDGKEFDFDHTGRWKSVNCHYERVPSTLIPREILNQIAKNYGPETKIVWFGRQKKGYRVELSNGVAVNFSKRFKIMPIRH